MSPNGKVHRGVVLVVLVARFFQLGHAVLAIMLELSVFRADGIGRASASQTSQWKVVVQSQHSLGIVEALDKLSRFGEIH